MHRYRDLKVWQEAVNLAVEIADCTKSFPPSERYVISDQLKRAAVSVASNIAEGAGRKSTQDFNRFLNIAVGSLFEVDTQLEICFRMGIITENVHSKFTQKVNHIGNMIYRFQKHITQSGDGVNMVNEDPDIYLSDNAMNRNQDSFAFLGQRPEQKAQKTTDKTRKEF